MKEFIRLTTEGRAGQRRAGQGRNLNCTAGRPVCPALKAGVPAIQNKDLARWFVQNRYKPNGFGGGMAPRVPLRPFVTPKRLYLM